MNVERTPSEFDSLLYLLAERACRPLTPAEDALVERLLRLYPDVDREELDRLAAQVELSFGPTEFEPLPAELRSKILLQAEQFVGEPSGRNRMQ